MGRFFARTGLEAMVMSRTSDHSPAPATVRKVPAKEAPEPENVPERIVEEFRIEQALEKQTGKPCSRNGILAVRIGVIVLCVAAWWVLFEYVFTG